MREHFVFKLKAHKPFIKYGYPLHLAWTNDRVGFGHSHGYFYLLRFFRLAQIFDAVQVATNLANPFASKQVLIIPSPLVRVFAGRQARLAVVGEKTFPTATGT